MASVRSSYSLFFPQRRHCALKSRKNRVNLFTVVWCFNYAGVCFILIFRFLCTIIQYTLFSDDITHGTTNTEASCEICILYHFVLLKNASSPTFGLKRVIFALHILRLKLDGSLLSSNPFERPTQISTDFKKTSALA